MYIILEFQNTKHIFHNPSPKQEIVTPHDIHNFPRKFQKPRPNNPNKRKYELSHIYLRLCAASLTSSAASISGAHTTVKNMATIYPQSFSCPSWIYRTKEVLTNHDRQVLSALFQAFLFLFGSSFVCY